MSPPLTFAIVAGEHSGDILGAGLVKSLKSRFPDAAFVGIGGPRMQAEGFHSLFPMEALAVMGLVEVLRHLPRLLKIRRALTQRFLTEKPTVFIGIDAPDFNLGLEKRLRKGGVKTVHYVSPTVWAWRQGRIKTIAKSVDHMLCLLPFEKQFYDEHQVGATFVGHPMADDIPLKTDRNQALAELGLPEDKRYVGLLPGSRGSELERLGETFLETAKLLHQRAPDTHFIIPLVSEARRQQFEPMRDALAPDLPLTLVEGNARLVMGASDAILLASGTAALEAMLVGRPMVVAYKLSPMTWRLAQYLVKTRYVSLPNLLANQPLVPELLQHEATPSALAEAVEQAIAVDSNLQLAKFAEMHLMLQRNASEQAAEAVMGVVNG